MDLSFPPEQTAFREDVQTFLQESLDPELARKVEFGFGLTKAISKAGTRR